MKRVLGAHTLPLYERTSRFRIYEHNVIPGLFQTAAYCAAMLSFWIGFLKTPGDLDAAVAARMERQKVIFAPGKRFDVVLEEQALRTWFGTAEVQAGQLGRLLEMMAVPTVSLGIIPLMTERTAVASAGFWIFDDSLAALETPTASIEVTRPQEIELYARMFGHLQGLRRPRGSGAGADHQGTGRTELAQHRATSWTGRPRGSYHRGMGNPGTVTGHTAASRLRPGSCPPQPAGRAAPARLALSPSAAEARMTAVTARLCPAGSARDGAATVTRPRGGRPVHGRRQHSHGGARMTSPAGPPPAGCRRRMPRAGPRRHPRRAGHLEAAPAAAGPAPA